MSNFFIHAVNIHQGGGRILLNALLQSLSTRLNIFASLDSRFEIPDGVSGNIRVNWVIPSILNRASSERWLSTHVGPEDLVLCLGNLPPLFKVRGHVIVFLQNRYLVDDISLSNLTFKTRVRLSIERLWLLARMGNVDEFYVQTPEMKRLLTSKIYNKSTPIKVMPFVANRNGYLRSLPKQEMTGSNSTKFLYVATGGAHKNHRTLIDAWYILSTEGLYPILHLTLDRAGSEVLFDYIDDLAHMYGLQIVNEGTISHKAVIALYEKVDALIYPSFFESFGLPLIEARQSDLPVLAPEMDYVRDILDPEETFDPNSSISIARAVKRFLGANENPLPLLDANAFINHIFNNQ